MHVQLVVVTGLSAISKQLCIKEFLDALESGEYAKIPEWFIFWICKKLFNRTRFRSPVIGGKIKEEMGIVSSEESENQKIKNYR